MRRAYAFSAPYCIEFLLTIREGKHIMLFYLLGREGPAEVKMLRKLRELFKGTGAQSTAEYGVIVFFCVLVGLLFVYIFTGSLSTYHSIVSSVVCLPVP
jgi:hypothetical protein